MAERVTVADGLMMSYLGAMRFVPAWAPNVHPMLVHFPIALLFTGVVIDVVAFPLPARTREPLRNMATVLYCVGALAALATYLTGRAASQTVLVPGMAQALIKTHWDWAFWTLWYFAGLAAARVVLLVTCSPLRTRTLAALVGGGLLGLVLLYETADRGAELVYRHGVGVGVLLGAPH